MPFDFARLRNFRKTKFYDVAIASPWIGVCGWQAAWLVIWMVRESGAFFRDETVTIKIIDQGALVVFLTMQIVVFLLRPVAKGKSQAFLPRFMALWTLYLSGVFPLLPLAHVSTTVGLLSAIITTAGAFSCVAALSWLGRSFSILPEARKLVTKGPYRFLRHPLYAAEIVSILGVMLQFSQPQAAILAFAIIAGQIARMGYEERVLLAAFPEYADYMKRTARLIPGIY
jgi:protein-S-isoprenylcysteine O-methyltransferase Ste14